MPTIPAPPPDLPQVSGNKSTNKKQQKQSKQHFTSNYNNNNGLSPTKSSGTESSSASSSKNTTPSHPTTQTDHILLEDSPTKSSPPQTTQVDPGETDKVWERCWTLSELKQGSSDWTLAGDAGLLKYLQDFSKRITTRTHDITNQVDGLSLESQSSCGRLENVSNKFHKLSMEQFVENRVYDEDETEHTRSESKAKSEIDNTDVIKDETDGSADSEVLNRANQAVQMGLEILDDAFDQVPISVEPDSDSSGEEGVVERSTILPTELEPKDLYLLRPLPALIGSATFYETDHLGLRLEESSDSSDVTDSDGDSTGSTETEVKMRKKPDGTPGVAEYSGESSGDLFSEDETTTAISNAVKEDSASPDESSTKKKEGKFSKPRRNDSSDGDLFGSSSEGDLFSEEPKKEKKKVKTDRQISEETIESEPTPTSATKKKKIKRKPSPGEDTVFNILDSGSDDGDGESKTEDLTQSSRTLVSTSSKKTVDFGLFSGSDSDGDLFSPDTPKDKSKKEKTQRKQENKEPQTSEASSNVKTLFGVGESNFDPSDSDEDLFIASTFSKNTIKSEERTGTKKPVGGVQLFSGIDQAAILGNRASSREDTNSPITVVKNKDSKKTVKPKGFDLYDNSSPEEDLFSSMSRATEPITNKTEKITDKQTDKQKDKQADILKTVVKSTISNGLDMLNSSGEDSDDLFSTSTKPKSIVSTAIKPDSPLPKHTPEPIQQQDNNTAIEKIIDKTAVDIKVQVKDTKPIGGLFQPLGTDSDSDDDLFNILENKQPETTPAVPVSTIGTDLLSENDELFSPIQPTPEPSIAPSTNAPTPSDKPRAVPSLFSAIETDEKEDGGLFDTPASLNLFIDASSPNSIGSPAPVAKLKPSKVKSTAPTLFSPIDTHTGDGGLFDPTSPIHTNISTRSAATLGPPTEPTLLPSLTTSRPKNPGRRPPSQKNRQTRADNSSFETLVTPTPVPEPTEDMQKPNTNKKLSGALGNNFLSELNKAVGKGMVPGGSPTKRKPAPQPAVLFEDKGDLFSNPMAPKDRPKGAEMGATPEAGSYSEEEPSKLLGVSKSRPRPPGKRLPSRVTRTKNIPSSEDFGNFYTDPMDTAIKPEAKLFNGDLGDDLFAFPNSTTEASRRINTTNIPDEDDFSLFGNVSKPTKHINDSFSKPTDMPIGQPHTKEKQVDNTAPISAVSTKKQNPISVDIPEDLFASIALPKATKNKTVSNERSTASPVVFQEDPLNSKPLDNEKDPVEEIHVPVDKSKKFKVVKRTDDELFGGDDLFGALPDQKLKSDKPKKKKVTDSSKKSKKPRKERDPATMEDLFN
ncbi:WASH complex subunit FAM21C isoform X1 [Oopsacas minuta]|uniref:WASH complex subunit FAM21C isoform X1 n=1 Tax=Oopsacas minuta TaxID=111878 RepID=A0AAV7JTW6_9METZ|nr:WASH complex subunit FAM21C isoform X1 [Oopsacas minuta]